MIIPFSLLWRVSIPLKKALALGGIFSLSIFIIVASISRVAVVTSTEATDQSWCYVGTAIEMATGKLLLHEIDSTEWLTQKSQLSWWPAYPLIARFSRLTVPLSVYQDTIARCVMTQSAMS